MDMADKQLDQNLQNDIGTPQLNNTKSSKGSAYTKEHPGFNVEPTLTEQDDELDQHKQSSKERFWILLMFGLSTMINAVGWI